MSTTAPNPPRPRVLHEGTVGLDVIGVKRALSRAGYIRWGTFTSTFGPFMLDAVKAFQKAHAIPQTGLYGDGTHNALRHAHSKAKPAEWAFDSYSVELMREEAALLDPNRRVRAAITAAGFYWYAHRLEIAYSQARPFQIGKPPWVPSRWDCSAFATVCHYAGGAPDPNLRRYDGQGYTGTLMNGGSRCTLGEMEPGDLIFWGYYHGSPSPAFPPGSPTHVSVFTGYDGDSAMHLSNGHYPMGYYTVSGYARVVPLNHYRHYHVA